MSRIAFVSDVGSDRIAFLKSEQAASRLDSREQVGGRKSESGKTERVRRICLLCRNHTAAGPLIAAVAAGECNGAYNTVTIDDCAPHVKTQSAIYYFSKRLGCR